MVRSSARSLAGLALLVVLLVSGCAAWGSDGHKIVAQIAQSFLSSAASAAVNKQLPPGATLADIATLPDSYDHNSGGSWSSHLHYVDLPASAAYFTVMPACADGCVVTAIGNYSDILFQQRNAIKQGTCTTNTNVEPCALSFVTHFVGDVHQPMHVSYQSDNGGNSFSVTFYGTSTNLHSVWDTSMIVRYENGTGWQNFATELINILRANQTIQHIFANSTDPSRWANESFIYTQQVCYNFMPGTVNVPLSWPKPKTVAATAANTDFSFARRRDATASSCGPTIGDPYYNRNIVIVQQRLAAAGIRLATLLNNIYGTKFDDDRLV